MGDFQSRFRQQHGQKPECYADPELYDPETEPCAQECNWRQTCKIRVARAINANRTRTHKTARERLVESRRSSDVRRRLREPEPQELNDRDEEVGFFTALIFNGGLSGVRGALTEAAFAVDQIPRFKYQDPLAKALSRVHRKKDED